MRIGVLSHRGAARAALDWQPTADYLSVAIPGWSFVVVPLEFDAVEAAVAERTVDFLLVNPAIYAALETRYRVTRIATLRSGLAGAPDDPAAEHPETNVFGGVIFARGDRPDLLTIDDLCGRSLVAVAPNSLGGFLMAWRELRQHGIDPWRHAGALTFAGTHDAAVLAVRDGLADAGIVRTGILERMAAAGQIDLAAFHLIGARSPPGFPLWLSTPLYPEWPFSVLHGVAADLTQAVTVALLQMPADGPAARAGDYAGWSVALDYQPVHQLLRELRLPPYDEAPGFTWRDALARYWPAVLAGAISLLIMAGLTVRVLQLNSRLTLAKQQLEQHHELILNSVAEGIYGVDLAGRTTFANRATERMTGWSPRELIGRDQHEILHHTHADGTPHHHEQCPVYTTSRDNRPRFIDEDIFWRRDGTWFPVEYSTMPMRDGRARTVGSVVVFRDTSERHRAQERMRRLELEHAHAARLSTLGEMASGIAHELNQPLTAISSNARACARMLEADPASADACVDVMTRIAAQAERAGEIIRHMRGFVRKEDAQMRPVTARALLETTLVLLRQDARRHGIMLSCVLGYEVDMVLAQQTQIEQVLLNLARNAIEAMAAAAPVRRRLLLAARRTGERVLFRVVDTGPGVGADLLGRLFDPFVTDKPFGMGLGLSICTGIIESHGGRLTQTPTPGGGATFQFSLPLANTTRRQPPLQREPA
ncbi:MAG: PAS domain S-box protein [Chromatiaceae bacterium]|nr:MAG: PAS domain S-box protein [Chromatiaceae bacterium]